MSSAKVLYYHAVQLRHDIQRLDREVVTKGIYLPISSRVCENPEQRVDAGVQILGYVSPNQRGVLRYGRNNVRVSDMEK